MMVWVQVAIVVGIVLHLVMAAFTFFILSCICDALCGISERDEILEAAEQLEKQGEDFRRAKEDIQRDNA